MMLGSKLLAFSAALLGCAFGVHQTKRVTPEPDFKALSRSDASFCNGGLQVIYPDLDISKCLVISREHRLREKISLEWGAPLVRLNTADKRMQLIRAGSDQFLFVPLIPSSGGSDIARYSVSSLGRDTGSRAQAALREGRLDVSLILNPSRVHTKGKKYALLMVDPDAPSRSQPKRAHWRHWLVVDIEGAALRRGAVRGTTLSDYSPPTPPPKSGLHRYQFLVYEQPANQRPVLTQKEASSLGNWDPEDFTRRFHLGQPVAAVQFLTQNHKD